ncbi:MAG: hypothetical protein ACO2PM_19195 [Pyrobaculum sp.]|jgi:hypothetical protein
MYLVYKGGEFYILWVWLSNEHGRAVVLMYSRATGVASPLIMGNTPRTPRQGGRLVAEAQLLSFNKSIVKDFCSIYITKTESLRNKRRVD